MVGRGGMKNTDSFPVMDFKVYPKVDRYALFLNSPGQLLIKLYPSIVLFPGVVKVSVILFGI